MSTWEQNHFIGHDFRFETNPTFLYQWPHFDHIYLMFCVSGQIERVANKSGRNAGSEENDRDEIGMDGNAAGWNQVALRRAQQADELGFVEWQRHEDLFGQFEQKIALQMRARNVSRKRRSSWRTAVTTWRRSIRSSNRNSMVLLLCSGSFLLWCVLFRK